MRTSIYWLDDSQSGRIGIMPRPRGGDWLEDEIRALRDAGVDVIVSLLEKHEIEELDLQHEPVYCNANDIVYLSQPIVDRGVPKSGREMLDFARRSFPQRSIFHLRRYLHGSNSSRRPAQT